jgi:hypothetical protein
MITVLSKNICCNQSIFVFSNKISRVLRTFSKVLNFWNLVFWRNHLRPFETAIFDWERPFFFNQFACDWTIPRDWNCEAWRSALSWHPNSIGPSDGRKNNSKIGTTVSQQMHMRENESIWAVCEQTKLPYHKTSWETFGKQQRSCIPLSAGIINGRQHLVNERTPLWSWLFSFTIVFANGTDRFTEWLIDNRLAWAAYRSHCFY